MIEESQKLFLVAGPPSAGRHNTIENRTRIRLDETTDGRPISRS
jgi:hypothetical protein